jgi:serine protease Do
MTRCLVLVSLAVPAAARAADPPDAARAIQTQARKVIEAAEPSVVAVVVSRTPYPGQSPEDVARGVLGDYPAPIEPRRFMIVPPEVKRLDLADPGNVANHAFGSGLVLADDGRVLTNYHLVDGATKIFVRGAGGKGGYADIHAADARSDLAVLKVHAAPAGWKAAKLADARFVTSPAGDPPTVRKGDFVVVLANAFAAGFPDGAASASFGMVSSLGRRALHKTYTDNDRVRLPLYKLGGLLQTDARLGAGVSGGAVLDLDGGVIGLTSSVAAVAGSDAAGGYAIPMDPHYRRIVATLLAGREVEYGFLGVSTDPYTPPGGGAVLYRVTPGTPADKAGLRGGDGGRELADTVVAVDGNPITDMNDLFLHVGAALADHDCAVAVLRGGRTYTLPVRLAKFRNPQPWLASDRPPAVFGLRVDYASVLLQDLIQAQDRMVGYAALPRGVVVKDLEPGSPAERIFKRDGDDPAKWVIARVNEKLVTTPAEFYEAAKGKAAVKLQLVHTADGTRVKDVTLR